MKPGDSPPPPESVPPAEPSAPESVPVSEPSAPESVPPVGLPPPATFAEKLEVLSLQESGIAFVYAALDLFATHYRLSDAVLSVEGEWIGAQIFRLRRAAVSASEAARFGSAPGVYCVPNLVPLDACNALYLACQRALFLQVARRRRAQALAMQALVPVAEAAKKKVVTSLRDLEPHLAKLATARSHLRVVLAKWSPRALVSMTLLVADFLTLVATLAGFHGPERFVLGLLLGVITPGWSIVGLLRLRNPALEWALTVTVSLSLLMVAGQIMASLHAWHPVALEVVVGLVCAPSLTWQARVAHRTRRRPA